VRAATGAAPGKVILFGEHAVVYGQPAVAASLGHGLGATAEPDPDGPVLLIPAWGHHGLRIRPDAAGRDFDAIARGFAAALDAAGLGRPKVAVTIDGELPLGVGLGSSAAFAVSLLRALGSFRHDPFDEPALLDAAAEVEAVFHGTASGLDHTVVTHGGCLRYQRGGAPAFVPVPLAARIPVVVGWTRREGSTRDAVARLRARHDAHPTHYDRLFAAMGELAEAGVRSLVDGDLETLGALMDLNHGYLNACGVSSLANEQMVGLARAHGALGAKITGAGMGGAVLALTPDGGREVVGALQAAGFDAFATQLGG
jgi:hydroxymethylglutaryl-CoA reductase